MYSVYVTGIKMCPRHETAVSSRSEETVINLDLLSPHMN